VGRESLSALAHHPRQRRAAERLEHEHRLAVDGQQLVRARDVWMREREEQPALGAQAPRGGDVAARLGTQRLEHAVAVALLAPGVVDVELASAVDALEQLVAVDPHDTTAASGA